jgi:hypothetical protein
MKRRQQKRYGGIKIKMQHMFFFEEKMQHMLPWCSLEEAPVMLSASR